MLSKVVKGVVKTKYCLKDLSAYILGTSQKVESHATDIKQLEKIFC